MNAYQKGRNREMRTIEHFEDLGYACMRSAGSKGAFDVICTGPTDVLMIQVKAGNAWPGPVERESMRLTPAPPNARKLCVRWKDYARKPEVREVSEWHEG